MNDSPDFTPKEKYLISLYQDPAALFIKSITRSLCVLIPSVGLVTYYICSGDITSGIIGYAILLFHVIYRMTVLKRALGTVSGII